ncbi:MAG: 23S rRNA (guanosine(2251)-2'-O)-methyltransferase RlmB [Rhodocyclaceae bacterium]|nr:23S rRNA (guanosine(2251)-2'-O)-methyltransferase RlmB [Rhodocyclaceae bacterium]MBX3666904.1 23S rRNA (guanosine(2251)-2'-O)-methyltransferase RlmB [Rhodocyclaceae bacterium]
MADTRYLYGFHAVAARIKRDAGSVLDMYVAAGRSDPRMRELVNLAQGAGVRVHSVDAARLSAMVGQAIHQGVVAEVRAQIREAKLADVLDGMDGKALLLVLDGVTDPHNLGACLRVADAAGAQAVIAPRDRAAPLNATAIKVASGAAETVPYVMVTNLARALRELQAAGIWVAGAAGDAEARSIYAIDQRGPFAWVLGAEGAGLRRLTRETCDELASIPMHGSVESLNVSVAAGICLFEARRQRLAPGA